MTVQCSLAGRCSGPPIIFIIQPRGRRVVLVDDRLDPAPRRHLVLKKQCVAFSESLSTNAELVAGRRRAGRRRGLPESRCFSAWKSSVNVPVVGVLPTDEAREMLKDCSIGVAAISLVVATVHPLGSSKFRTSDRRCSIKWTPPEKSWTRYSPGVGNTISFNRSTSMVIASGSGRSGVNPQKPGNGKAVRGHRNHPLVRNDQEICMKQAASGKLIV